MLSGTIVVCTRNRVAQLRQCLAALANQYAGDHRFDILVVDNNSTDETCAVLKAWATRPGRRVITERTLGLSHARNAALAASAADVVAFLDDDALAPPSWLASHLRAHDTTHDAAAVGGPVRLTWPHTRPGWATANVEHWWSALDLGDEPQRFANGHGPYGTNMSVDRRRALDVGGFPVALGRRGKNLLSSEEAVLSTKLERAGGVLLYEPAAALMHQVLPERLSRRWILRRGFAQGRSNARRAVLIDDPTRSDLFQHARSEARSVLRGSEAFLHEPVELKSGAAIDRAGRLAGHVAAACSYAALAATGGRTLRRA